MISWVLGRWGTFKVTQVKWQSRGYHPGLWTLVWWVLFLISRDISTCYVAQLFVVQQFPPQPNYQNQTSSSPSLSPSSSSLSTNLLYLNILWLPDYLYHLSRIFRSETWISFPELSSLVRHQVMYCLSLEYLYNLFCPHYPCLEQPLISHISALDFWIEVSPSPAHLPRGCPRSF